uniref:Heterocycloanthracin/sonorensin family bacteriocin n=1 Tax=Parascaris univalens TaxID=6257 RepID=A0A915A8C0_PARUN
MKRGFQSISFSYSTQCKRRMLTSSASLNLLYHLPAVDIFVLVWKDAQ